jgi:hypothetical protein
MTSPGPHLSPDALDRLTRQAAGPPPGEESTPVLDPAELDHLEGCDECRRAVDALSSLAALLRAAPVEPPPGYGAAVRRRIEGRLAPSPEVSRPGLRPSLAAAGLAAAILTAAAVGLLWPNPADPPAPPEIAPRTADREPTGPPSPQASPDTLLADVESHLERARRLCIELSNRPVGQGGADSADIEDRARELLAANREYRRFAATTVPALAPTLDRLEPVLAEAARDPARAARDEAVRDLLFETRLAQAQFAAFVVRPDGREPQG